jgi:glucose/arabinose dehydrogenase
MEDTMVLPASALKKPLPLVPALAAAAAIAVLAAGFFFYQASQRANALVAASAAAAQMSAELAQAKQRIHELEQDVAAKKTELASALRMLPVEVRFHVGEPGTGFVAHFENQSTVTLRLTVEPRRARTGEYGRLELTIPSDSSAELSEKQGWAFRSGDTLTVSSGDYRPVSLAVP